MNRGKKLSSSEENAGEKIYMGNVNLPAPGSSYDYSNNPEWVAELKKCKKSLLHFAENHFYIINIDEGRQRIELRKYQKRLLKTLKNNRFVVCLASRQIGKALALDTLVPVPTGWTTMGELKQDDLVYGSDGNVCRVIKAHDTLYGRECYKIIFDNGEEIVADGEHQWFTESRAERETGGSVKTTKKIFKTLFCGVKRQEPNHRIPLCLNGIRGKEQEKNCNSKIRGQYHYIKNIIPVKSVPVRCITVDSKDSLFLVGKQYIPTHNSTVLTIYMLWVALFNEDQSILLAANKEESAKEVFKRVKLAYEMLPNYLKSPVVKYAETSMVFDNGSSISVTTTTSDTGRGRSVSLLCLDELAHIESGLLDTFWASVYPVISSSKKAKIFAVSTPKGVGNLFHSLYTDSLKKGEDWNGWASERIDWWEVPGRDDEWKQRTIKTMGSVEKFAQEFENVFISTGETAIDEVLYESLKAGVYDPKYVYDDGAYLIWEPPADDKLYIVGVDIGEGLGLNASVAQILDVTDLSNIKQVGQYYTKTLNPYNFTQKLYEVLNHWGRPTVAIERNSCGGQVVDNLRNNFSYENIVSWGAKPVDNKPFDRMGILSHANTKYRGVMNMRYWMNELRVIQLSDSKTLQELSEFIRKPNNTWSGRTPATLDDRVMSLVWALIVLENELCVKYFDVVKFNDSMRPEILKSLDYGFKGKILSPVGFYNNEIDKGFNDPLPTLLEDNNSTSEGGYFENEDLSDLYELGWRFIEKQ